MAQEGLPERDAAGYHPLQNIRAGVESLRVKSVSFWETGHVLSLDEGRITSKSRRNKYKTRLPKPIRMGFTVDKLVDFAAGRGGYFVLKHLVHVGKFTYDAPNVHGKMYDIVNQLVTDELKGHGKTVVLDSAFTTVDLMTVARNSWKTRIIGTCSEQHFN
jgi:hypothetical protein